jgi:hypothetical protein
MQGAVYAEFHKQTHYAECHNAECHKAERRGAITIRPLQFKVSYRVPNLKV